MVVASVRGSLGIVEIAHQMRRLFGPTGGGGRQDAPYPAEDANVTRPPSEDEDFEAQVAYRKNKGNLKAGENGQGTKKAVAAAGGQREVE